jgi:CheY-like chemotaxis protein
MANSMQERKKVILIIDDEPDHLYIAQEILHAEGYEVLTHRSPFGVPELVKAANPDLVLMDVNMPMLPGDDLAAFLKADERTRNVQIVLYSAADEALLKRAVTKYRLQGYIRKGVSTDLGLKVGYYLKDHDVVCAASQRRLYAVE